MINNIYIIVAQFTCLIGLILLIYSYHKQDNQRLLFFQIFSLAFYCLGYIFLGAYIGFFVCLLELIKGVGYYKTDKDNFIFLISIPIYIFMIILCSNVICLLPIIASIIDSLSLRKKLKVSIVGSVISNILWVIYDNIGLLIKDKSVLEYIEKTVGVIVTKINNSEINIDRLIKAI